jgi:Matrixin
MSMQNRKLLRASELQSLEDRRLLAAFGTPWPEPRDLTISFPADGVAVGSYDNNINALLDQVANAHQWEELVLRAYQTWSIHADINVGVRNDQNLDFGTPGLTTADPRFGEFRIGALPQTDLLASSLPFQAIAGTYSGDLLLNSNEQFKYHDWANNLPPDPATLGVNDRDLYSLVLHEVGNTLGLADSTDPLTVMFGQYTGPKGVLSADDISRIQALYGARTDPFESSDNGALSLATLIPSPVGFDPTADVIRTRGSLARATDVDIFSITPVAGQDSVRIRIDAAGLSLLKSKLQVLDATGQVLSESSANSVFDNDHGLELTGLQNHSVLYVRVAAVDPADIYAVGDYRLVLDYRSAAVRAADPEKIAYDAAPDALFANFGLIDDEQGENDSLISAEILTASVLHTSQYFEHASSVSGGADVDFIEVTAPAVEVPFGRLVVNLAGVGVNAPDLKLQIVDASNQPVGASGRLRADGTWTLEVAQPQAGQDYFIRVSVDPNSAVSVGNYVVTAEFTVPSEQMNDMIESDLSSSEDLFIRWTATKTKLYRFDLNASGGNTGDRVKLTIYDAHTREMRVVLDTTHGVTRTALAWLQQGEYILRFTAQSQTTPEVPAIHFALTCDGLSDDQGDGGGSGDDDDEYYYYQGTGIDEYDYDEYEPYYYYYYEYP